MVNQEAEDLNDEDEIECEDCQKTFYGWAIKDNNGNCPTCQRLLV